MKISVLTPTFNHGQYLEDAIQSVKRQRGPVEHVVADGGSADQTTEVLRRFDSDVKWLSRPDTGQSDALNRAYGMATGDIIGWLNADEFYLPGVFEEVRTRFENDTRLDVLVGDAVLVDPEGNAQRLYAAHRYSRRALESYDCYIPTSSLFVRRRALTGFKWDTSLRTVMDWDLLLALAAQLTFLPLHLTHERLPRLPRASERTSGRVEGR